MKNMKISNVMPIVAFTVCLMLLAFITFRCVNMQLAIEKKNSEVNESVKTTDVISGSGNVSFNVSDGQIIETQDSVFVLDNNITVENFADIGTISYDGSVLCGIKDGVKFNVSTTTADGKDMAVNMKYDSGNAYVVKKMITAEKSIVVLAEYDDQNGRDIAVNDANMIADTATTYNGDVHYSIMGTSFLADGGIVFSDGMLQINNGGVKTVLSVFTNENDMQYAGFDTENDVNGITILSGKYEDNETGYAPYMWNTDSGIVCIASTGLNDLSNMFVS